MQTATLCRRATDQVGGGIAFQHAGTAPADTMASSPDADHPGLAHGSAVGAAPPTLDHFPFAEIWAVDFEYDAQPGDNPKPVCLVAWELRSGRKLRIWRNEFGPSPPYTTGGTSLFIAYYASAEIGCHLALSVLSRSLHGRARHRHVGESYEADP